MKQSEYDAALKELEAGRIVRHNGRTAWNREQLDFIAQAADAEPLRVEVSLTGESAEALNAAGDTEGNGLEGYEPPKLPENPPIESADSRTPPAVVDGEDVTSGEQEPDAGANVPAETGTEVGDADVKTLRDGGKGGKGKGK